MFSVVRNVLTGSIVALAGGSTPRELYGLLASDDYRDRTDWDELEVYFGDERAVPATTARWTRSEPWVRRRAAVRASRARSPCRHGAADRRGR